MPLAPLASLMWYGPAVAPIGARSATETEGGQNKAFVRQGMFSQPVGAVAGGISTRLFRVAFGEEANALAAGGDSRSSVRVRWDVKPGGVSQSDIEAALLDVEFEPGWTMRKLARLQLAWFAGDAAVPESGAVQFRSPVDSRVRIGGTVSGGVRTVTTRDGD